MANASTYQCPNCSGVLSFDPETGLLTCEFCESTFHEGEVERAIPLDGGIEAKETEHVRTVDEFLEHAPWEAALGNAANVVAYSCPSCGAEVVADQSTVSTECPYCGNNMLVAGISSAGNMPTKVLPFSITKEQAQASMTEHFQHKWYLSRAFSASLEHMQGVYVPYHLYDFHVDGHADYIGYKETEDNNGGKRITGYNSMRRAGHADFSHMPVDASSKMPDAHMDSIAPFHFEEMRDFSASYVAGYLSEVADEDPQVCLPRAENRARKAFEDSLKHDAMSAKRVDGISEVVSSETNCSITDVVSCVLPVWLMHCTWEDHQMLFAVNGQTGKCVGDLPLDRKRRIMTVSIMYAVAVIVSVLLWFFIFPDSEKPKFLGTIILILLIVPFFIDKTLKGQMTSAVEVTGGGMDYSSDGLQLTYSWTGEWRRKKDKAASDLAEECARTQ